jgi:hypothetical protein
MHADWTPIHRDRMSIPLHQVHFLDFFEHPQSHLLLGVPVSSFENFLAFVHSEARFRNDSCSGFV